MDFISASGRSFMIDFNPRMSNFAALDTRVTGLTPGLHRRLHDAVVHRRTHAFAPLDRSALVVKYAPSSLANGAWRQQDGR